MARRHWQFSLDGLEVFPLELSVAPAIVGEILFTFMLVWVIMNVATAKANVGNRFSGIAIALVMVGKCPLHRYGFRFQGAS